MVHQQQQRCQDNNIFVQIFPWKKINARFQSNTTFVILFMYFCFVYFQSGYNVSPIFVKNAYKNNLAQVNHLVLKQYLPQEVFEKEIRIIFIW